MPLSRMPSAAYRALPGLSSHVLSDFRRSPLLAHRRSEGRWNRPETASLSLGSLVHCLALEPQAVAERYARQPADLDGRTAAGKAWRAGLGDRQAVSAADWQTAEDCLEALLELRPDLPLGQLAGPEDGWQVEATLQAGLHGHPCKGRLDLVSDDLYEVVDVKTCTSLDRFEEDLTTDRYGYALQAAFYLSLCSAEDGEDPNAKTFSWAVVETQPPFRAVLVSAERLVADALRVLPDLIGQYAECQRRGCWPRTVGSVWRNVL